MVDRCENCNCDCGKKVCGLKKATFLGIVLIFSMLFYTGFSIIMLHDVLLKCTSRWARPEIVTFVVLYMSFFICYLIVLDVTIQPFKYTGIFILWICTGMWGCISNIWNRFRLPNWSDTRFMLSVRRAITRTQPEQEVSISDNESDEDRPPPLPPRNKEVKAARTTMFQKLTPKVSQGASSSTAQEDESSDLSSSIFPRPHCSKQSAPSLESSRRRRKKLSKREHFKNMMSKVTNLNVIREEDLDKQEASEVKVPLISLTRNSASEIETEQETSFTLEPHQSTRAEQHFGYANIDEIEEQVPAQGVYGVQAQAKTSSTGDKQRDPDQTSASSLRSTKNQSPVVQDSVRHSPAQPSTSSYVPVFKLWNQTSSPKKLAFIGAPLSKFGTRAKLLQSSPEEVLFINVPLSTLKNQDQERTLAVLCSDSQEAVRVSGTQCQSAASHIKLPEVESQSRPFDTGGTEGNQISLLPSQASANLQVSLSQTQEQISAAEFSGSQVQSRLFNTQSSQGNRDPAAAGYVKFQQLEELMASGIRTDRKQSSPEQLALTDVQTSLQSQVSSIPGIQRMPTYQGQTSSAGVYDLQRQRRASDLQRRRLSRKHAPFPNYKKASGSKRESLEEGLNLQQPIQSSVQFTLAKEQLRTPGIGEVHESSSEERGLQGINLQEETSMSQGKSRTSNTLEKLRKLHQASAVGFPTVIIQKRHFGGEHELPLSTDYAGEQFRGKAVRASTQKRRESSCRGPIRESSIKAKRTDVSPEITSQLSACAGGGLEISSTQRQQMESSGGGYLPHSTLSISEGTTTQEHVTTTPLNKPQEGEDRIRQRSSGDPSHLKETDKQETQIKETFVSLDLATCGVVLSEDRAEDETEADSSESSLICDQSKDVLDLSHIEVPLSPKDVNPSKDKGESQNLGRLISLSSARTKITEGSAENTSQLSACATGELEISSIQRPQIESSGGGYLPRSTLSISRGTTTQEHVATTQLNKTQEGEDRIRQLSSGDLSHLKETDNQESQIKETFVSLDLATGGIVLSTDGAEDETEDDSSEFWFMRDQSMDVLDLTHIEVPLPQKDIKPSKDRDEHQN